MEKILTRVSRETWTIFVITMISNMGWSASLPFYAVYLVHRDVQLWTIGADYLVTGVLVLFGLVLSGRLTDSLGPKKVMLLGYPLSIMSAIFLGVMAQIAAPIDVFLLLYPVFSFTLWMPSPATSAIIASQGKNEVWSGFSLLSVANNIGFAIGPALGGILSQWYGYSPVFFFSAATLGVASAITLLRVKAGRLTDRSTLGEITSSALPVRRWLTGSATGASYYTSFLWQHRSL